MRAVADVDGLRNRHPAMDDGINPFEYRDVDCSGRSLATLMVAWVGAAMVASVLLRWKYMWIALTILTLLFLFACGYAACNARRFHERVIANEEARILEGRTRDGNIQSVSGTMNNCAEINEPPAYQTYWITDLPPPYAVVVGVESSVPSPPQQAALPRSSISEPATPTSNYSNPPPYCVAIQSDLGVTSQSSNPTLRTMVNGSESLSRAHQRSSNDEPTNSQMEQVVATANVGWNNDTKMASEENRDGNSSSHSPRVLGTGTYLSNILSCTFGRGQRRINPRRNSGSQATTITLASPMTTTTATISTASTTMRDRQGIIPQPNREDNTISSIPIITSSL